MATSAPTAAPPLDLTVCTPVGEVAWRPGTKFGAKRCRHGELCRNRKCGFSHPMNWQWQQSQQQQQQKKAAAAAAAAAAPTPLVCAPTRVSAPPLPSVELYSSDSDSEIYGAPDAPSPPIGTAWQKLPWPAGAGDGNLGLGLRPNAAVFVPSASVSPTSSISSPISWEHQPPPPHLFELPMPILQQAPRAAARAEEEETWRMRNRLEAAVLATSSHAAANAGRAGGGGGLAIPLAKLPLLHASCHTPCDQPAFAPLPPLPSGAIADGETESDDDDAQGPPSPSAAFVIGASLLSLLDDDE